MNSPRRSKDVSTPKTRKRKLDSLQQKGSMMKYFISSPGKSPVISSRKNLSQPTKPGKVISADSDEESNIEEICDPLSPLKEKFKKKCILDQNNWKPKHSEGGKYVCSPKKRAHGKVDEENSCSSRKSFKGKKEVVACPNSPKIDDIDRLLIPPKKRKSDNSVLELKSSKVREEKWTVSPTKPKLSAQDSESKTVPVGKKRPVITCPDSPLASSSSHSSLGSTASQKERMEQLFGPSPRKKSKTGLKEARSAETSKSKSGDCPELPKISSRYKEITGRTNRKDPSSDSKCLRTPTKSDGSSSGSSKVLVVPDSPLVSKDTSKKRKDGAEPTKPWNDPEDVQVLNVTSPTAISKPIIRRSQMDVQEKDLLSVTSSSSKIGKTRITIMPEETRLAANLAFGQNYGTLLTAVEMHSSSQICPDFQWALSNRRHVLDVSFERNFTFHTRFSQDAEAVRLLRLRVGRHSYPNGRIVHEILDKIIPNVKNRVALHRSLNLLYHILMLHPSGAANGIMRQYYWSFMSQRFDDKDPCSRWEHLRTMLKALLEEPWNSADRQPVPSPSETKSHVLTFLIRVLADDLKCWINSAGRHPAELLRGWKDVPLAARLLWPQDGNTIGYVSVACRDLVRLHLQAAVKKNRNVLAHTKELLKMMASVTQMCDVQVPLKMRRVGERMSHLGREMAVLFLDVCGLPTSPSTTYRDVLKSVASSQLRLLLSTSLLNRLDSGIPILEGQRLTLTSMLQSYLLDPLLPSSADGHGPQISRDKAILSASRFKTKPAEVRWCTIVALSAYMKTFCTAKTWFFIRDKRRYPALRIRTLMAPPDSAAVVSSGRGSPDIFSTSFTFQSLMDDLKAAKLLLHSSRESKSLFSFISG